MTDGAETPQSSPHNVWLLVGAIVLVVTTLGVAAVISLVAVEGSDDTEGRLDTAAAAAALSSVVGVLELTTNNAVELPTCPAGPVTEVLGDLAEALGGGAFERIVGGADITTSARPIGGAGRASPVIVECLASDDEARGEGELGLILSPSPREAVGVLRDSGADADAAGWVDLGASRGGQFAGRCTGSDRGGDCAVLWYDDELLAAIGGSGPAFEGLEQERLQAVLAAYLPSLVDALAP